MVNFDAKTAIEIRDALCNCVEWRHSWFKETTRVLGFDYKVVEHQERVELFLLQVKTYLEKSVPMLWDFDVWVAATKSHAAFYGTKLTEEQIPENQVLHILQNGALTSYNPTELDLSPDHRCQMILVSPALSMPSGKLGINGVEIYWSPCADGEEEPPPVFRVLPTLRVGDDFSCWHSIVTAAHLFTLQPFVSVQDDATITRQQRRLYERRHRRAFTGVKVVTLRKLESKGSDSSSSARNYSCQWLVNGHWRKLPGKASPVYVRPYVKGPKDKPFRVTETVYQVRR